MEPESEGNSIFQTNDSLQLVFINETEYLRMILGPKNLPLKLVLPVTLVYAAIFVTGVFGNVVTCIVIRKNPAMQTATNYYLFSLAVSDLLLLVLGLPNELSVFWQQYPWELGLCLCKIRAYISEMSSYVSVLTIVAFSMERYLAICHPLYLYAMSGLKRPIRFILAVWLIGIVCAVPFAIYTTVNYIEYPPESGRRSEESAFCAMLSHNMPDFPLYELSCLIFFLVPLLLIMVLYLRMGLTIQRKSLGQSIEGAVHGETRQTHSRKAIIRMLSAVVITFFICWAPFHAQRLLYVHVENTATFAAINGWLYPLAGCLYYFSTTINPILYNVMSVKYRSAFKETLYCSQTSPSLTRDELSNAKESTTVCGCGSSRSGSQVVRVRSIHCQRSVKYSSDCINKEILTPSPSEERRMRRRNGKRFHGNQMTDDDGDDDDEENNYDDDRKSIEYTYNSEENCCLSQSDLTDQREFLSRSLRSLMIVRSSNGSTKCEITGILSDVSSETRI